jgi:two-component system response regulator MtrA
LRNDDYPSNNESAAGTTRGTVLVVEDDPTAAHLLADVLRSARYHVLYAGSAAEARFLVERARLDLVILDLVLPDEDGLVVCAAIREQTNAPILVCSATRRRRDPLLALKLGADEFIPKPFDVRVLSARIEALLRRAGRRERAEANGVGRPVAVDDLVIDHTPHRVTLGGVPIQLTPTEYRLLTVLASRPNEVVARHTLGELVWGTRVAGEGRTIDVHVGRLRVKLAAARVPAPEIVAVRGFGYKLVHAPPAGAVPLPRLD